MNRVTETVIGCAIEVHKHLGPSLLESTYDECTCYEMVEAGLVVRRQVPLPVVYKGVKLDCGYRIDAVVEEVVVLEFKTEAVACARGSASLVSEVLGIEGWAADQFSCSSSKRRPEEADELIDSPCLCVSVSLWFSSR